MIDTNAIGSLIGAPVRGSDDDKIGSVEQVYVAGDGGQPVWAAVRTGLFGTSESFVPLEGATFDGETLVVAYDKSFVKDAPRIDADSALSSDEEADLYRYYNLGTGKGPVDMGVRDDYTEPVDVPLDSNTGADTTTGYDTSGPTTDEAMTRSEEQLHVGTEKVEAGRARLRKYIVTEQQTVTVPVSHDEVRLEREPITDTNYDAATAGPELSEEEHEVILTEDRVVVAKEAVPVERVSLGTETVTENREVTEDVSHEEIELEDDGVTPRTTRTDTTGTDGV